MALSNKGGEIMPIITDSLREEDKLKPRDVVMNTVVTIADSLIEEGRKKGLEQGMQQGIQQGTIQTAREDLIHSLKVRFDIVPESMINTINEINDPATLRVLLRKAIKAASLDEFTQIAQLILE
jgi:flagellar biosynthesis/type III secretory pathway protein FliH